MHSRKSVSLFMIGEITRVANPDLEAYIRMQSRITSLADRWVKAWPEYGYRGGVGRAWLSVPYNGQPERRIEFYAGYVDGIGRYGSLSLKYLDDDSTLEVDSKTEFQAEIDARNTKAKLVSEAEAHPAVRRYKELTCDPLSQLSYPFRHFFG